MKRAAVWHLILASGFGVALVLPSATVVTAASQQAPTLPKPVFVYDQRIGLANWKNNQGCLAVFDFSIKPGMAVTLVSQSAVGESPDLRMARVAERLPQTCDDNLSGPDSDGVEPAYYRIDSAGKAPAGVMFAILEPADQIIVRDGRIEADLDADGAKESFRVCNSIETVHFMVWTGPPSQGRPRWHDSYYVAYDMVPSCTDQDVAGMEALGKAKTEALAGFKPYTGPEFPPRFATRADAQGAGCRFAAAKGPTNNTCVLGGYRDHDLNIAVYQRALDGAYAASDRMTIPSWYEDATLSLVDVPNIDTDWLAIETTGVRGTGLRQRVLLLIGWDGKRFRTAAANSLEYRCSRPTAPADYALQVKYAFESLRDEPGLRFDYALTKDGKSIGNWSEQIRWVAPSFTFAPFASKVEGTDPVLKLIQARISKLRTFGAVESIKPDTAASNWPATIDLLDVMAQACSPVAPTLASAASAFTGKWHVDPQTPTHAADGAATPSVNMLVTLEKQSLTIWRAEPFNTGSIHDVYDLGGGETIAHFGQSAGKATTALDGDRMVATIKVDGRRKLLKRTFYRSGKRLVMTEADGDGDPETMAYYVRY